MTTTIRRGLAMTGALAAALLIGAVAAATRGTPPLLTFVVFTLTTAPVAVGAAWALTDPAPAGPRHPEQSVELHWLHRAGFAAFLDLIIALGLAATAAAVAGVPEVPLAAFIVLGGADLALRYRVLAHREA